MPTTVHEWGHRQLAAYDERAHARKVSELYGTRHEEFVLEPDPAAMIDDLADHFGEPFADPAAIPTWHLARMTRRHVTVALNGDGGDEAFAGYQRYFGDRYADLYRAVPAFLRAGLLDRLRDRARPQHILGARGRRGQHLAAGALDGRDEARLGRRIPILPRLVQVLVEMVAPAGWVIRRR